MTGSVNHLVMKTHVFKTSEMSMWIAVLMAGKIQVCGRDSLLTEEPTFL